MTTEIRSARQSDNGQLLNLFSSVPMEGDLVLSTRRDPDFFALYNMQGGSAECLVAETEGDLTGVGTFLIRPGWLDGRKQPVGYLGDLRTCFSARRSAVVAKYYQETFATMSYRYDCKVFLTAILASNHAALNALVRSRNGRRQQPYYHLLKRFSAVSVHFSVHASHSALRIRYVARRKKIFRQLRRSSIVTTNSASVGIASIRVNSATVSTHGRVFV